MHIVLGLLGSIVTILYLLDRLGIDLGGLNPFYWQRRRAWAKKYEGDPIHSVEDPMHVAAILIVGAAKLNGDLSAEQKRVALEQAESMLQMMVEVVSADGDPTAKQSEFVAAIRSQFVPPEEDAGTWS
jgi:hypothetical protein